MMPISMEGTDPAGWGPKLDGLTAAHANHRLLYEDESIRVLSINIAPGQTEQPTTIAGRRCLSSTVWRTCATLTAMGMRSRCQFPTSSTAAYREVPATACSLPSQS
jgi:hypothetical protein